MIPNRIVLKGFLSYREPVAFDFRDESLWMVTGPNGSGKSAIFDAMTYALFGMHRLGARDADQLIHKEADVLEVAFEFEHAGIEYRIQRGLRRAKNSRPSQKAFRRPHPNAEWDAIEDVEGVRELNDWVEKQLGMKYETFTTSVLLLQGQAENLLSADPKERRAVIHGIVDMQRYIDLHALVDEQRRRHRAGREAHEQLLASQPEITQDEIDAAAAQLACLHMEREAALREVEHWQRCEIEAEHWPSLCGRRDELQRKLTQAAQILADAATIEADWQNLQALHTVVPLLTAFEEARANFTERSLACVQLKGQEGSKAAAVETLTAEREQSRSAQATAEQGRDETSRQLRELDQTLMQTLAELKRVEELRQRWQELTEVDAELAKFPADLEASEGAAERERTGLAELAAAMPWLVMLRDERTKIQAATERLASLAESDTPTAQAVVEAERVFQSGEIALEQAKQQERETQDHRTRAKTRLDEIEQRAHQLENLDGRATCFVCGQTLSAEHLLDERRRTVSEKMEREVGLAQAEQAHKVARKETTKQTAALRVKDEAIEAVRTAFAELRRAQTSLQEAIERAREAWRRARAQLPDAYRTLVAVDGANFPGDAEIAEFRSRCEKLPAVKALLADLRKHREAHGKLLGRQAAMRTSLASETIVAPAEIQQRRSDHETQRREHDNLTASHAAQERGIANLKRTAEARDREFLHASTELASLRGAFDEAVRQRDGARLLRDQRREALPSSLRKTPTDPGPDLVAELRARRAALEGRDVAGRFGTLGVAREQHADWEAQAADLERQMARIPPEAREPLGRVRRLRQQAQDQSQHCGQAHRAADRQLSQLQERRQRREQLLAEVQRADRHYHRCDRLAQLLGPRGLQLHLMREAEAAIVASADEVLQRISGGEMSLELARTEAGDPAENPLQLQVRNRSVGDHALQVAQLSGSQKFRVAVCLALAIGQYGSGQTHSLESVIIDEGFGCLDREGRHSMIQELHHLRSYLRRIILVAHEAEFAESFPAGYRTALVDGRTQVSRILR